MVTIILLLILAGITISLVIGQNGIIGKASRSQEKQIEATEIEKIKMAVLDKQMNNSLQTPITLQDAIDKEFGVGNTIIVENLIGNGDFITIIESNNTYKVENNSNITKVTDSEDAEWQASKITKHPDQSESNLDIGIGTDGKAINLDLWFYTLMNGTYALNQEEVLLGNDDVAQAGYKGGFTTNGEIQGTMPKYIKRANDDKFIKVTDISNVFRFCTDLKIPPEIPDTVVNAFNSFCDCSNLTKAPIIPDSVINMEGMFIRCIGLTEFSQSEGNVQNMTNTFWGCSNLEVVTAIPNKATDLTRTFRDCTKLREVSKISDNAVIMRDTFYHCTTLETVPAIPNKVENMVNTFSQCTNLKTISSPIPESVTLLINTFIECRNLTGNLTINAKITGKDVTIGGNDFIDYTNCFYNTATVEGSNLIVDGTCPLLDEVIATKTANSHIEKRQ